MSQAVVWACVAAYLDDRTLAAFARSSRSGRSIVDEEYRRRLVREFGPRVFKLHRKYRARGFLGAANGCSFRWSYVSLRRLCLSQRAYLQINEAGFDADIRWVELDSPGMRMRVFLQAGADRVRH